jgi:hypothetical protein
VVDALHVWLNVSVIWVAAGAVAYLSVLREME